MTFHIYSVTHFQLDSYVVSNANLAPVRGIRTKRSCQLLGFDFRDECTSWSMLVLAQPQYGLGNVNVLLSSTKAKMWGGAWYVRTRCRCQHRQ